MIHPSQRTALMTFVETELASHGVAADDVNWANQDFPVSSSPWVMLRSVSSETEGIPDEVRKEEESPPDPNNPAGLYTVAHKETEWEFQIGSPQGDSPDPLLDAGYLMDQLELALHDSQATYAMRKLGLSPKRVGTNLDISAVARGSQWESRASMSVVFSYATARVDTATSTIESMDITGTLSPVSGTIGGDTIGP